MNSIYGSWSGNITGTLYFLLFQLFGILLAGFLLHKKDCYTRLLCGSVLGSVLLQWLPALFAFFLGFSVAAHAGALLLCAVVIAFLYLLKVPHAGIVLFSRDEGKAFFRKHSLFLILCAFTFLIFCIMLSTHTLLQKEDGLYSGQATYGDMSMHLGFITSIARQQTFPPEYSVSPGDRLCYPFLCDSISSSIYLFGASLRYAYMLPMYFAFLQVLTGFYCFAYSWLKKTVKAALAWFFFFYNGGLAFVYFIDWSDSRTFFFKNIFTEYYQTPTNLVSRNIRWVNIIVDMLLPQRATLFGYAVLFCCIWLLWRAVFNHEKDLFPLTALLTGSLPMIHTHSFLAMGLISAAWLLMSLCRQIRFRPQWRRPGMILFPAFLLLMCRLQLTTDPQDHASLFLRICIAGLGALFCFGLWCLFQALRQKEGRRLAASWALYLLLILIAALPQLFTWTFQQTSSESFLNGHFNWANLGDNYLWFYIKNWGIILLALIPGILYCSRKQFAVLSAGFLIWFVAELVAFSPNTYDNNKLLYVTYLFFCCISADYAYELYSRTRHLNGIRLWSSVFLFLCCFSALLSMGRDLVSDYQVYSSAQVAHCKYIEEHTPSDATFLTSERHLNEAAVLAGRKIVSGAWIYLGPHGIYDEARAADVRTMYENPAASSALYEKYGVDYVVVSSWERGDYHLDENAFDTLFPCIFAEGDIRLYQVVTPL